MVGAFCAGAEFEGGSKRAMSLGSAKLMNLSISRRSTLPDRTTVTGGASSSSESSSSSKNEASYVSLLSVGAGLSKSSSVGAGRAMEVG